MFYAPIFIFSLIIFSNVKADGKDLSKVRRETTWLNMDEPGLGLEFSSPFIIVYIIEE